MVVVGRKDIGAQGWQLAQAAGVLEVRQARDLVEVRPRPCELYRGPRSQLVAIVDYDESVFEVV